MPAVAPAGRVPCWRTVVRAWGFDAPVRLLDVEGVGRFRSAPSLVPCLIDFGGTSGRSEGWVVPVSFDPPGTLLVV